MDLKSTLNLPDPDFTIPMKADLATREPQILAIWDQTDLYHQIQEARKDAPRFLLHDGPPYTNAPIHLGTSLNKLLKDFVLKSKNLMGYRVPYVPGYDNHGLPIELSVQKKFAEKKITPSIPELRQACREHAQTYIDIQTTQFKRLGILGLWEKPYRTMDYRFEAEIVRVFKRLVEAEQVYRGLKPVMWSPTSRTALADTEIVYEEYVSNSIYVKFPLVYDHTAWSAGRENLHCVIWTTTPWTIPANVAVAFHPALKYGIYKVGEEHWILLTDLAEKVIAACGIEGAEKVDELSGSAFEYSEFGHPIFDRTSKGVLANYVTTEDGTGIVHTAPGHGREDFVTGAKYGLQTLCPVNERGVMTEEAGEFAGLFYRDCDKAVVDKLRDVGALVHHAEYHHSYPHAERDGKPVIFRATEQWFVSIDDNDLRERMMREIEAVDWVPQSGYGRIKAMISGRPDWCISRQRPWGVGIPVFYGAESGTPVLDPVAIEAVANLVANEGSDAWYTRSPEEILPAGYKHPLTGETSFTKETDVFDVWFDSGSTHLAVLEGNVEAEWAEELPCELYLEGSDQHRGWFNVSLILSTAIRDGAPYKQVLTHGFVNDENGRKMSKRLGNIIDPVQVCNELGADVLRLWVASIDYEDDMPCGPNILKACGETYRTIRNTLRFLLGNLNDFEPLENPKTSPMDLDRWIVEQAELLSADVVGFYNNYEFRKALTAIHDFCVKQLSSQFVDAIKDRMYCEAANSEVRRGAQWACLEVLRRLVKLIAPICPFTAEETYQRLPGRTQTSVHLDTFEVPDAARIAEIGGSPLQVRFERLWALRSELNASVEEWRKSSEIRDSGQVLVKWRADEDTVNFLQSFEGSDLANLMKVSWVEASVGDRGFDFAPTPYHKCERSKVWRPDVDEVDGVMLSARDRRVLGL